MVACHALLSLLPGVYLVCLLAAQPTATPRPSNAEEVFAHVYKSIDSASNILLLKDSIKWNPSVPELRFALAQQYDRNGQPAAASAAFTDVLQRCEGITASDAYLNLCIHTHCEFAVLLHKSWKQHDRHLKAAIGHLDRALQLSSGSFVPAILERAFIEETMGNSKHAVSWFEKVLQLQPDQEHALVGLALSLWDLGELQRAEQLIRYAHLRRSVRHCLRQIFVLDVF